MSHATADPDPCGAEAGIECTDASLAAAAEPDDETGMTEEPDAAAEAEESEESVSDEITVKAENWDAVSEATFVAEEPDALSDGAENEEGTEATDGTELEGDGETTASGFVESGADDVRSGNFPTVPTGGTACSLVLGIKKPDLETRRYVVAWQGNSSGGAPAWRLEFYHGKDPINTRPGSTDWKRLDGSGDKNPRERYVVSPDDVGPDGRLNWRMCVRNLGADDLTGDWTLETKISVK